MKKFIFVCIIEKGIQKEGRTINQVIDFVENVFVKLGGVDTDDHF